jgi:NtrC-family two-component system response regulator AlgB
VARILVVDDERSICTTMEAALKSLGHQVECAESGELAIALMRKSVPDLLITDLRMDGMSGLDLLGKAREYFPSATVVVMTAFATVDTAVTAIRNGAYDYLVKPFTPEALEHLVTRIEEFRRLKEENCKLKSQVDVLSEPSTILTQNARMQKVLDTAKKVAVTDSTVLITGESGTGKTLLAKVIHDGSARQSGPFVVVNCATLSENLLESELFGHVRGAFTGAVKDKMGRLQVADSGTVFLDEIGEISPNLQTKLLRFLQEREFERVGDTKTIRVDVRIIAATNKDLEKEVKEGRFREDLYFRLNVIDLHMPSLRQRPEDIPALADQLLERCFLSTGRKSRPLSEEAKSAIRTYAWPGNIRELKNALERATILCTGDQVVLEDLPDRILQHLQENYSSLAIVNPALTPSDISLEDIEKQHIRQVLNTATTLEEAASILGINLSTLWRKRRRYGLE